VIQGLFTSSGKTNLNVSGRSSSDKGTNFLGRSLKNSVRKREFNLVVVELLCICSSAI